MQEVHAVGVIVLGAGAQVLAPAIGALHGLRVDGQTSFLPPCDGFLPAAAGSMRGLQAGFGLGAIGILHGVSCRFGKRRLTARPCSRSHDGIIESRSDSLECGASAAQEAVWRQAARRRK